MQVSIICMESDHARWSGRGLALQFEPNLAQLREKSRVHTLFWKIGHFNFLGHRYAIFGNMLYLFWTDFHFDFFGKHALLFLLRFYSPSVQFKRVM